MRASRILSIVCGMFVLCLPSQDACAEAMLQYFGTSYREITDKMPELAEANYNSLWLPPPTKGSGGLSVGYDLWDRFDLGGKDQRGSVSTRYGTEAELIELVETAHRFGIRVYFDNIMNHNAFDIPGFDGNTPIDVYPGMVPEDFHLRVTEEGFYRKWDNTRDWQSAWQVLNLGLSDLIDIAHETPNTNFGPNEGDDHPKISFIRHPDNPEYYLDTDLPIAVTNSGTGIGFTVFTFANKEPFTDSGYGPGNTGAGNGKFDWDDTNANGQHDVGETSEPFTDTGLEPTRPGWDNVAHGFGDGVYNMGNPVVEDVNQLLIRAARWQIDHTKADGYRLDAVKHVPDYFFGQQSGVDKDYSSAGYLGQVQEQYNLTHGYSDWDNHRDTVFDVEQPRDDAMVFGEHLGEPPGFGGYVDAGMRLVDNDLRSKLNGVLGNGFAGLQGLDGPGGGGFADSISVMHAQSHDNDFAARRELQHAFYFTRAGLPLIYTDGNYQAETLGESGGAFPRHANTAFLGQFGDGRIPNAMYMHSHFARGTQHGRWADDDVVAYDRIDKRENGGMSDTDGVVVCFMMNDNFADGQYREIDSAFPAGAWLWQYAAGGAGFYYEVPSDGKIKVIIPPGGYFAFSWRSPETSDLWSGSGGSMITITENGNPTGFISTEREDGPDGDPGFNPYGVFDPDATDFKYTWFVPRVTSPSNVNIYAFADGSAENILLKLDGGVDLNSQMGFSGHPGGDDRDNPPALSTDVFLGYEQMEFMHRQYREKFAAVNTTSNNVIGSAGAETYEATIGTAGFTIVNGAGANSTQDTAQWVYHNPQDTVTGGTGTPLHFDPAPESASGSAFDLWVKIGYAFDISRVMVYYTTDGSNPEGAGGVGRDNTKVVEMAFQHGEVEGGTGNNIDWWKGTIPAQSNGTTFKYKIAAFKDGAASQFPSNQSVTDNKKSMLTAFRIRDFSPGTVPYPLHGNYGEVATGLAEGFHILKARPHLQRPGRASIYNTYSQTFYYDAETPGGEVKFPGENDTLGTLQYGAVVRADRTVTRVFYHIDDGDTANDDENTGINNGNGTATNGVDVAWVEATRVTPTLAIESDYPREWRFTYNNVPSGGGAATIKVRLVEASSSTNFTLTPAQAHVTELVRNVFTDADPTTIQIAFPQTDGETIGHPYDMKVWYSKTLPDPQFENFLLTINGEVQGRDNWSVNFDVTSDFHELVIPLPVLWNGVEDFVHTIHMEHTTAGNVTRETSRLVRALPIDTGPFLAINTPPEFDSDGRRFIIELPDVPAPTAEQRRYVIQVESELDVQNLWLQFDGNAATATLASAVNTPVAGAVNVANGSALIDADPVGLAGTVTVTTNDTTVTGSGTSFLSDVKNGSVLRVAGLSLVVTQVVSDTELAIGVPYSGPTASGQAVQLLPAFNSDLTPGALIDIAGTQYTVQSLQSDSNATLTANYTGATASGLTIHRVDTNPRQVGNRLLWDFDWTSMTEGNFRFTAFADTDGDTNTVEASVDRTTEVVFVDQVPADPADLDDDDDGLFDGAETIPEELPETNPETWNNGDVHVWLIYGRTDPRKPDSDEDGLPDGLESGWRSADASQTDTNRDSNGDGEFNFAPDLDPPFFNTVPDNNGLPNYVFNDSRTKQINGSMTDPNNPDSDGDGLLDGIEDANRNGWLDGDGLPLQPTTGNPSDDRPNLGDWPDGELQLFETWLETDPNNSDTDGDGASDGYGEDKNLDGVIEGDSNSNRVYDAGEQWTETDPLNVDTDGDTLPDGWEANFGLNPLVSGSDDLTTAVAGDGDPALGGKRRSRR